MTGERAADLSRIEPGTCDPEDLLAALIEQLHQNWDRGDNVANDELVMQIREHIRRRQSAARS